MVELVNPHGRVLANVGDPVIERKSNFDKTFFDRIGAMREADASRFAPEMVHVARIPVDVVHLWDKLGFDFERATAAEILARLRAEGLDDFIATERKF